MGCADCLPASTEQRSLKEKENNLHYFAQPYIAHLLEKVFKISHILSFVLSVRITPYIYSDVSESGSSASSFAFGVLVDG